MFRLSSPHSHQFSSWTEFALLKYFWLALWRHVRDTLVYQMFAHGVDRIFILRFSPSFLSLFVIWDFAILITAHTLWSLGSPKSKKRCIVILLPSLAKARRWRGIPPESKTKNTDSMVLWDTTSAVPIVMTWFCGLERALFSRLRIRIKWEDIRTNLILGRRKSWSYSYLFCQTSSLDLKGSPLVHRMLCPSSQ